MKAIKIRLTEFAKKFCGEQTYEETKQVNGYSQEEPVGEILMCFLFICSNPIHHKRLTLHTSQDVLKLPSSQSHLEQTHTWESGQCTI